MMPIEKNKKGLEVLSPNEQKGGDEETALFTGNPEDELKTDSEVGQVYELKKIYSRLCTIENYLDNIGTRNIETIKIREMVSSAISLFELLISNIDKYKENLKRIIILFYKFIMGVYSFLKKQEQLVKKEVDSDKQKITISNKEEKKDE